MVTLKGPHATLEPLTLEHEAEAVAAVGDGELWNLWYTMIVRPEAMGAEISRRLRLQSEGTMMPFAVRDATGRMVGMTTFMAIDRVNRRVEIGHTWYAKSAQGTRLNPQCKLLLLEHAFEAMQCNAVELRTHHLNVQSRAAIAGIGAKLDGILRNHIIMPNGTLRDTCVYSIIAGEWPVVAAHLRHRLAQ